MGRVRFIATLVTVLAGLLLLGSSSVEAGTSYHVFSQGTRIVGRAGTTLKVVLTPQAGGAPVARSCYDVNDDDFPIFIVDMTEPPAGGDICSGTTSAAQLPPGNYRVTAGLYATGAVPPLREVQLQLVITFYDRYITINGAALSNDVQGDANCDGAVNSMDIVAILGVVSQTADHACAASGNIICGDPLGPPDALALAKHLGGIASTPGACPSILPAPELVSPPDGAEFNNSPRTTTLDWEDVPGAAWYVVMVDEASCEPFTDWCSALGWGYLSQHATETSWQFDFGSAGIGRWRVAAVGADGKVGPFSEWSGFRYLS